MEKKSIYCVYLLFIILSVLFADVRASNRVKIVTILSRFELVKYGNAPI